ncbi:response regulator transcription factor [Kitasatospora purpeofusca]|uniref:response regulator transcription factor n=1 Tax=Kitasatospora purpeofusca TaxID=67352 RepID=UPI00366456E9
MTVHAPVGAPLTDGEIDILALYADGHTSRTIAAQLGISQDTVWTRTASIRHKLGTHTITQSVVVAYRTGQLHLAAPRSAA